MAGPSLREEKQVWGGVEILFLEHWVAEDSEIPKWSSQVAWCLS